ncbi:uncharacterized protein MED18 isoform X3 [Eurosta solidaginis]|uniref:uncharacterized protein MED18 isoform X3 n=1 Tax=Eurosta solidaginis TaxID=178769 RepID=UPI003530CA3B
MAQITSSKELLSQALQSRIIPNQEYLLQGSILDSAVDHLIHRLRGLCDTIDASPESFHDVEVCLSLRQPTQTAPLMLRVRRALDRDAPFQLRYIGQPELDRSRPTLVRSSIDVGCTSTILDFLTELGCRLDFEYVSRGTYIHKDAGFTKESLLLLKSSHLDTLLGTTNYGQRVIFEHNLLNWQNEQGVNLQTTVCGGAALLDDSIITEKTVEDILKKSVDGKHILEYYSKQQVLNPKYSKSLAATIAAYLISSGVNTNPKTFESLANQIASLFLSESKDIYYIHKKCQKQGGSLYTKYHNSLSKLRLDRVISKKPNEKEQPLKARNVHFGTTLEDIKTSSSMSTPWISIFYA